MKLYEHILDKEKRTITVRLYGLIGSDVDGNSLAHSIAEWGESPDIDIIRLRINSGGGNVFNGMSIVSALRSSRAVTHCYIDGVAASMAAVIAVSGDKLYMMDYAKLMIHDPYLAGVRKPNPKEQKALDSITDMLSTILSRRGIEKDEIARLMKEETWFGATEAKEKHLADEIIPSKRKAELAALSSEDLLARISNEYQPQKKESQMKEIAKLLGLPEDATEQQIIDKINGRSQAFDSLQEKLINYFVSIGEKNGTITEKNKEKMLRLAKADFDLFADLVQTDVETSELQSPMTTPPKAVPQTAQRLSDAIARLSKQERGKNENPSAAAKNWDWYQRHNPEYLSRLEKENPEEFERLLNEYESNL